MRTKRALSASNSNSNRGLYVEGRSMRFELWNLSSHFRTLQGVWQYYSNCKLQKSNNTFTAKQWIQLYFWILVYYNLIFRNKHNTFFFFFIINEDWFNFGMYPKLSLFSMFFYLLGVFLILKNVKSILWQNDQSKFQFTRSGETLIESDGKSPDFKCRFKCH